MRWQELGAAMLLGWALVAAHPAAGQERVDGSCNNSVRYGCTAGVPNIDAFPDRPDVYRWRCDGEFGGRNSGMCSKLVPIDGVCDESTRNGCAAGQPNDAAFLNSGSVYAWRCDGLNGGANSGRCTSFVPVDGVCDQSMRNGCTTGTANNTVWPDDNPTIYLWRCDGAHGGSNSSKCSIRRSDVVDGVCDESVRYGCAAGTANNTVWPEDNPTIYLWRCDGLRGGAHSSKCGMAKPRTVPVDGGWSAWSACSATSCGAAGSQRRTCTNPAPAHEGRTCLKLDGTRATSETRACTGNTAVNGRWSAWSTCSTTTCGETGTQTRACNNPAPACGGSACSGPSSRTCGGNSPVDGGWSGWSACSATACGASGTQTRACTNPTPACGGSDCSGASSRTCTGGNPVNGGWSGWSACSATACGAPGTQTRACTNPTPACGGSDCSGASSRSCTGGNPVNGGWSGWSACSATACGASGTQTRACTNPTPACGGSACSGASSRSCTGGNPVNGGWSGWSACSATACGVSGTQTRACTNPTPACGGSACTGPSSQLCIGNDPVNGGWSGWSDCSASACGETGTQTRTCTNPTPACSGSSCAGSSSRTCTGADPRDGVWLTGDWGAWSACTGSICSRSRSRTVTCRAPGCGGAACDQSTKPEATQTRPCPSPAWVTGRWGSWSACSETDCGVGGHQTRSRTVSCPCGTTCPSPKPASTLTRTCTGNSPVNGGWSGWSACSASACGAAGTQTRTCTSPTPACGGRSCAGRSSRACTGNTAANGSCNNAVENGCAAGTFQDVTDTTTQLRWRCVGGCGGTTAQCAKAKPVLTPLTVSISVSSTSRGQGTATANVSGGTAPYTYSWSVSGASGGGSGASISFSYRSGAASTVVEFTVTVSDSTGRFGTGTAIWGTPPGGGPRN